MAIKSTTVKRNPDGTKTITTTDDSGKTQTTTKAGGGYIEPKPQAAAPVPIVDPKKAFFGSLPGLPQSMAPPVSAYGTSSAEYGQVSPTGQVEVPPMTNAPNRMAGSPMVQNQPAQRTAAAPAASQSAAPSSSQNANYRSVTVDNKDGTTTNYQINPDYSFKSQTGKYEFDFWTPEGQKERINNALDTINPFRLTSTAIGGEYVPVASEAVTGLVMVANLGSILSAGANVLKAIGTMNKVGSVALTAGGAEQIASNVPSAAGTISKAAAAGSAVENTKNVASGIKAVTSLLFNSKSIVRNSAIGYIIINGFTGKAAIVKERTDFAKDSGELALKLREVGMTDMADELYEMNKDLKDDLDVILPYIPFLGKMIEGNKINQDREILDSMNLKYEAAVEDEKQREIINAVAAEQQAAEVKRQQDLADLSDKRAYEEKQLADKRSYEEKQASEKQAAERTQTEEQRAYNEEQRLAQQEYNEKQESENRAYNEEQARIAEERRLGIEATETQEAQGSTLNFGLLSTSGAKEFVDKDKAAKVYFGKIYDELTPEQKMLLNLLKGE